MKPNGGYSAVWTTAVMVTNHCLFHSHFMTVYSMLKFQVLQKMGVDIESWTFPWVTNYFRSEIPAWAKFGQKIKILWLCLTKLARLPQMYWIRWWCSHFLFALERLYFRQIWSKIDSCLTWIFCSLTNSNMQNSMLIFSFLGIRLEILFFGIIWSKIQNCFFNENFGI